VCGAAERCKGQAEAMEGPRVKGGCMPRVSLAKVSTAALKEELRRRVEALPRLIAQRDELNRQIAEIEASAPAALAPKAPTRPAPPRRVAGAKPARGTLGLTAMLAEFIKAKGTMSVADAAQAVLAAGYENRSKHFQTLVRNSLAKSKRFVRVGRGLYKVRG